MVRPDWIDHNGHLNLAYYLVLLDWGTDALWDELGLGAPFRAARFGTFAAESHILYRAELLAGQEVTVDALVLAADAKRLHTALELRRGDDGVVSAQQEVMYLCVDLSTRRVTSWPDQVAPGLDRAVRAHSGHHPDWVGRRVSMPSRA